MTRRPFVSASLAAGAALALAACAAPSSPPPRAAVPAVAPVAPVEAAAATITPEDMYARIAFLADDLLEGRGTPSPGLEIAAAYLVNQYRILGLEPAGEEGTYYQWFPFPLLEPVADGMRLEVQGPRGREAFVAGRDFFIRGGTARGISAPLTWIGEAPEALTGDAALRDRIAVAALSGPYSRAWRAERNRQARRAQSAGALAIVHVLDPSWPADTLAKYAAEALRAERALGGDAGFPQFFLTHEAARRLLAAGDVSLAEAWRDARAGRGKGITLAGVTATAGIVRAELDRAVAPNVVAVVRGSDPVLRDEYVVVSAHLDHEGVGEPVAGDSIYNGADDNASGTAALVEIAQAFAELPTPPRRSIVFLHVSAEEKGLLGSRWYADHPTVPLEQIVANVNLDMIGRNAPDSVVVIGKEYSTLGRVVNAVRERRPDLGLVAADDVWPEQRFFYRSDHYNFVKKEIPALFFFSGVHEDYHLPSDEVEEIDPVKAARVARYAFYTLYDIANADERPEWYPEGLAEVRALTR